MKSIIPFGLVLAATALACSSSSGGGSSSGGPTIDSISLPSTFTVTGTQYVVQGTITFHDNSAAVTGLREKIPAYGVDDTITVPGVQGNGNAQVTLGFQATAAVASGTVVEIDVSLVDANGAESNVEPEQITVP